MEEYSLSLELLSPTIPASGEGWGSIIDNDIIFDDFGIPYFPARRLKGLLKESSEEVIDMLNLSNIGFSQDILLYAFGTPGSDKGSVAVFNNLYVDQYEDVLKWCKWAIYEKLINIDSILSSFTEVRQQTSIDECGVSEENSLRTSRVLKKGIKFIGNIYLRENDSDVIKLIALSCSNLRHLGSMRHRGFGEVKCTLFKDNIDVCQNAIDEIKRRHI